MDTTPDPATAELLGWLDAKRRHVREQFEAMTPPDRRRAFVPSGWTPRGLLHHLALDDERFWFRKVFAGESVELAEGYAGWIAPEEMSDEDLLRAYDEECRAASAVIAAADLDDAPRWWFDGADPMYGTLRELLLHVIVETATHAGHLDLCRELADGGQRLVIDTPD